MKKEDEFALSLIPTPWFEAVKVLVTQIQNLERRQGAVAHFTPLLGGGMEFRLEVSSEVWEEAVDQFKINPNEP